ncbi:hypothetical protein LTR17_025368 [Elasticomyces elasticus]|nr:hypothetical protein LTR17_025368 [Elasticomyces elasticus]
MAEESGTPDSLEARLQSHAAAFESLMALTPAREYFGSQVVDGLDPSEQWSRKKQTKEQKRAAKKAKLDPANQKSALDIMKERERKRKRELGMEQDDDQDGEGEVEGEVEEGGEKKRQKVVKEVDDEAVRAAKRVKRAAKRQQKREKVERKKGKVEARKMAKQVMDLDDLEVEKRNAASAKDDEEDDAEPESAAQDVEMDTFDASGLADPPPPEVNGTAVDGEASSVPSSPAADSPAFDIEPAHSTASSSSSILPPSIPEQDSAPTSAQPVSKPTLNTALAGQRPLHKRSTSDLTAQTNSGVSSPKLQLPASLEEQEALQARLRARIEELRQRRKADGPDGKPAKSRQELLDQRRKKEELRKAAKKEQRRKDKENEIKKREEQLRVGSGSPTLDVFSPRPSVQPPDTNSFSFSRLAFEDGTAADVETGLSEARKRKGPSDTRTALEAAEKKKARLAGLDPEKREAIAEKDLWLNAKKHAHGERVRDDTSLLKKALKRQEKDKGKSREEWQERQGAVVKGREMKQKKRDNNLAKRREEKGGGSKKSVKKSKGGGKKGGDKKGGGSGKGKGRAGFEGKGLK